MRKCKKKLDSKEEMLTRVLYLVNKKECFSNCIENVSENLVQFSGANKADETSNQSKDDSSNALNAHAQEVEKEDKPLRE